MDEFWVTVFLLLFFSQNCLKMAKNIFTNIQVHKDLKAWRNTQQYSKSHKALQMLVLSFQIINEDIWNDLITLAKTLVKAFQAKKNVDEIKGWKKFPWFRQKVRISEKNIHQLPHPGKMSPIPKTILTKPEELLKIDE